MNLSVASVPLIPIFDSGDISMAVIVGCNGSAAGEVTDGGCLWLDLQFQVKQVNQPGVFTAVYVGHSEVYCFPAR